VVTNSSAPSVGPAPLDRRIDGNVDPSTGAIDQPGSLLVTGDIVDLMRIRCRGSLTVHGVIGAADVLVGGDVESRGGIVGHDKGLCRAAGNVTVHYLQRVFLEAGGNVSVDTEVRSCHVVCGGKLVNAHGHIRGGDVTAVGGIYCKDLGGPSGVATIAAAGNGPALQTLAARAEGELRAYRDKARRVAHLCTRFLHDQKILNAAERERATELMFKSYELEKAMRKMLAMIRSRYEAAVLAANAEILVLEAVYPGVIVRFPGLEASINDAMRGPLKIAPRPGNQHCIVVTEKAGACIVLKTRVVIHDPLNDLTPLTA